MTLTAREIIKREYGDAKNFMTPYVIRYGKINRNMAYEISEGTGMNRQRILGLSVASYDPTTDTTKREYELSQMFTDMVKLEQYIESIKFDLKAD